MKNNGCRHELKSLESKSCAKCACFMDPRSGVYGLKSPKYNDPNMTDDLRVLEQLRRAAANFVQMEPLKLNPVVNQILEQLVSKFGFGLTTYARAVYMFHHLLKEKPQFQYQQLRYGTVCLYLAAKMTERQEDIPHVGRFIREACKVFEKAEYVTIEEEVFQCVHERIFEVGFFPDLLDYYRVKGVVFSNEQPTDVAQLEAKMSESALSYIRSGEFLAFGQEKLAALILHTSRQDLKVSEVWNEQVEFYTRVSTYEVYNIVKEMRKGASRGSITSRKLFVKHSISSVSSSTVTHTPTNSTRSSAANSPKLTADHITL